MHRAFADKVVLITGAAQGIGRCLAVSFGAQHAHVVMVDRQADALAEAAAEVRAGHNGPDALPLTADLADAGAIPALIDAAIDRYGRLDLLVNNAAIGAGSPPEDLALDAWQRVLAVNLTAPFLLSRCAAPHLRASHGAIVNIASTRALQSEPNSEAYAATKGGLVALTHAMAASLAPDVRVNAIAPGWIDTAEWLPHARRRTPEHSDADRLQHFTGRVGRPEDIAELVMFLADSERAGFISGHTYPVDGGMTRKMIYEP